MLELETGCSYEVEAVMELKERVELAFKRADVLVIGYGERFLPEHRE
jgi:hypothetical protein